MADQEQLISSEPTEDLLSDEALDAMQEPIPEPDKVQPVEVTTPEGEPETPKSLFFGKYETEEAAQEAWKERERFLTQTRQELAETRRQAEELRAFREQAEPVIRQMQQQQQQPQQVQLPQPPQDFDWTDPDQVRNYVGQLTQAQQQHFHSLVQQERARSEQQFTQLNQAQQARQEQENFGRTVMEFRSKYQDIDEVKALQIAEVFKENQEYDFDVNLENLEVAYQVVSQPGVKQILDRFQIVPDPDNVSRAQEVMADDALRSFVLANPSAFTDTDDDGWAEAKNVAAKLSALTVGVTPQADPKTLARVTTGSGGTPATAAPPNNPHGIDPEMWKEFGGDTGNDDLSSLFNR